MSFDPVINEFDNFAGKRFDFGKKGDDFIKIAECKGIISNIFQSLNWGIISGSYTNIIQTKGFIATSEQKIQNLLPSDSPNAQLTQEYLISGFIKPLKHSLSLLKHLVSILENRLDSEEIQMFNKHNFRYPNPKIDFFGINKQVYLFQLNCEIARFDHTISISESYLHDLILVLENVKNKFEGFTPFDKILEDKCKLLIFKVAKRLNKDQKNFTYQLNHNKIELNEIAEKNYYYKDFIVEYKRHYRNSSDTQALNQKRIDAANLKRAQRQELNLRDYHVLIKHYKDDHKNINKINDLLEEIEEYYTANILDPDADLYLKRAWQIGYNYFLNNRLSFLLKQKEVKEEQILEEVTNIETIQTETKVYNFFPYWKLCVFYGERLKVEIEKKEPNFESLKVTLDLKEKYFQYLKNNLKWCIETDFQPFMSQKEDCVIDIPVNGEEDTKGLYISSGYILPLNYQELQKKVDTIERSIQTYITHLELYRNIFKEKEEINEIKKDVIKHERKQIEILGIFAALVIFASSTIEIFKGIKGFDQAAKFSLIFSYSLVCFVIMIWMISRENIKNFNGIHIFFSLMFFTATVTVFALSFSLWPFN